jgi:sialic acid synthase SpsE/endonuclease IV
MFITKSVKKFIIFSEDSILECLQKIEKNKRGVIFVVEYDNTIKGIVSDGDLRRWLTTSDNHNFKDPITKVMNENFVYRNVDDDSNLIFEAFSNHIRVIPILNNKCQLVSVAFPENSILEIGKQVISEDSPCFVIAEIGNNHNGSIQLAKKLIGLAAESGADCVKFQMRDLKSLYKNQGIDSENSADLGDQYTLDLLSRFQLSNEELFDAFDYCKNKGVIPLCTPWDINSFNALEEYGMEAYKISSADLTNIELISYIAKTKKPIICSTGMSTEYEIRRAIKILQEFNTQYILLHCNSTYPTPNRDVNLRYLDRLSSLDDGRVVGYSGHERGYLAPTIAVALGARIVEKHFTIDKGMEGNDHKVSLVPSEFREMVQQIRLTEELLGNNEERILSQGEYLNREVLAKSLVINQTLRKGMVITRDMIEVRSPGKGLQPCYIEELPGKIAQHDFYPGDFFYESDISETLTQSRKYSFNRPFGIPVRYHDFIKLISGTNVDFVEFHLSYKDLEVDLESVFNKKHNLGFNIHCPELFKGDHILNLCSKDKDYRQRSVKELQNVVEITRKLKMYFPLTKKPLIITNVGGFSESGFLSSDEKEAMYFDVAESLNSIDTDGVEIVVQTMPPFPWHFGGQRYHNLFVSSDEIYNFCKQTGFRVCLDVSHAQMACTYFNWELNDYVKKVSPYSAYIHIVDALGIDGEGVQIGKGDVNFFELSKNLNELIPEMPFIPEVWQGHKQNGSGFWNALDFLEKYL